MVAICGTYIPFLMNFRVHFLVGFQPYLQDQLVSFSALTLLVWSYDL